MEIRFGPQTCGSLDAASAREWLVTDGLGGFAMGTVGGLRTRRYHGLLIVATESPIGRRLGPVALDPVRVIGDRRIALATHQWSSGIVAPEGYRHLAAFELIEGVPRWTWQVDDVVLETEVAMLHGAAVVGVTHRLVYAERPVRVELVSVATWRDVHGERSSYGEPPVTATHDGFVFDDSYRVRGPGYEYAADWWLGSYQREEAARGLQAHEVLCHAGPRSKRGLAGPIRRRRHKSSLWLAGVIGQLGELPVPIPEPISCSRTPPISSSSPVRPMIGITG